MSASSLSSSKKSPPTLSSSASSFPAGVNAETGQWQDRENLPALKALVKANPVLSKIQAQGAKAAKKLLYPTADCDYFYEYLSHFPEGTWALPQVFCRVIRGLNSNHWLALCAARFRERRHTGDDNAEFGSLKAQEVERLQSSNAAFFEHYIQVRPDKEQLERLRQRQAARNNSTNNNKKKGEKRSSMDTVMTHTSSISNDNSSDNSSGATSSQYKQDRVVPLKKRRVSLDNMMVDDNNSTEKKNGNLTKKPRKAPKKQSIPGDNNKTTATTSRRVTMETTAGSNTPPPPPTTAETASLIAHIPKVDTEIWKVNAGTGQFVDRNNLEQLQDLVELNPVLGYIQERGGKTPKRALFPNDATCEYFFEYLESFPAGTWALPQVFCRVIKGLNSNHWLALAAMRFRDRRHHGQGEFGSLRPEEVKRLQKVNLAFYCHYVCQPPQTSVSTDDAAAALTAIASSRSASERSQGNAKVAEEVRTRTTHPEEKEEDDDDDDDDEEEEKSDDKERMPSMLAQTRLDQEAATVDGSVAYVVQSDSVLQRQILQEHLLRTSLLSPAPQQPTSLLSLAGGALGAKNSLYQELMARVSLGGTLPHRDALPWLAANLNNFPLDNEVDMAQRTPQVAAAMPTLASSASTNKSPSYVVGTSMQMHAPHSMSENALASSVSKAGETLKNADYDPHSDDDTDAETSAEHAAAPKDGRGRGEWSMLDILAATASAARLEVGTD